MADFSYQNPFPLSKDETKYKLISTDYVSNIEIDGRKILKIDAKALAVLSEKAMEDVSFLLRPSHLEKVAKILEDPEATDNDRFVAYTLLKNALSFIRIRTTEW